jgi:hypothetical protein
LIERAVSDVEKPGIIRRHHVRSSMSDPMKQAWNDVADRFSALGRMMKERYQDAGEDDTGETATADAASESDAAFRQAFERVVAAGREVGDRAVDVARDDDVKAQAKRAASSLNEALSATMNFLGEEVGGFFRRTKGNGSATEITASDPPADGARH